MEQYYSMYLSLKVKDEEGARKALREHIDNDNQTHYHLEDFVEEGVVNTLDGLVRVVLAGRKDNDFTQHTDGWGRRCYISHFVAAYGWDWVVYECFKCLVPYIGVTSMLDIYTDSGVEQYRIKGGKVISF